MAIIYQKTVAMFKGTVADDEADALLEWLSISGNNRVAFAHCQFIHTANLQVLMAAKPTIAAWPKDPDLDVWLKAALHS